MEWREFARSNPSFNIGQLFQRAALSNLGDDVVAAYDAPFPNEDYKGWRTRISQPGSRSTG